MSFVASFGRSRQAILQVEQGIGLERSTACCLALGHLKVTPLSLTKANELLNTMTHFNLRSGKTTRRI